MIFLHLHKIVIKKFSISEGREICNKLLVDYIKIYEWKHLKAKERKREIFSTFATHRNDTKKLRPSTLQTVAVNQFPMSIT